MTKAPRDAGQIEKIRESIIEAAVAIMHRTGFQGLTMRKIAAAMGMSATNIYNYFSNKDEIYINILIRGFRLLHEELNAAREVDEPPLPGALRFIRSYLDFGMRNHHYYEIMFSPDLPKYADYIGTPFEAIAKIELEYSKKIIDLAIETAGRVMEFARIDDMEEARLRMIEIWCTLHGMISLRRSTLVGYAVDEPDRFFEDIVNSIIARLKR